MAEESGKEEREEMFCMRLLAGELRWMEQEDIVAQTEMLVVAKKLEDAYFKTREMTKH